MPGTLFTRCRTWPHIILSSLAKQVTSQTFQSNKYSHVNGTSIFKGFIKGDPHNVSNVSVRDKHTYPPLDEKELEEQFTRGSGPGGQSVNKTTNACILKHIPTGLTVKCHVTRSLVKNRELARMRLQEKLDYYYNGENSYIQTVKREESRKRRERKKQTKERLEKLKAFKEREGLT